MKYECYPVVCKMESFEYLLPLGLLCGPALLFYAIYESSWGDVGKGGAFLLGILFISAGVLTIKAIIMGYWSLKWDHEEIHWGFRKLRWSELSAVIILNQTTVSSISEAARDFERFLVFKDFKGKEQLRLPFYRKDYADRNIMNGADPIWNEFVRFVERRYSLVSGSMIAENDRTEQRRSEAIKMTTPAPVAWGVCIVAILLIFVLLFQDSTSLTILGVMSGYFILVMALVRIGKKIGWDKTLSLLKVKHRGK